MTPRITVREAPARERPLAPASGRPLAAGPAAPGEPPAVSVVVAVYQRADFLALVFESLLRQTASDFEVLVADDGSGPAVAACIAAWQGRFRRPIRHAWHEDRGFRKTVIVNRAVTFARAPYLVFVDGDCILHRRFLERHLARRRPLQALSGRRVSLDEALTARLTPADVCYGRLERPGFWWWHATAAERRNGLYLPWLYGVRGRAAGARYEILGCNFSLPRKDFLAVNGYDERIVTRGMEDVNLKVRLVNAGVAVRCIAQEAIQYHLFHTRTAFGHDARSVASLRQTSEVWTPHGIVKSEPTPAP
jgi:glycosyltransferase involved in cell wall biosynthesis